MGVRNKKSNDLFFGIMQSPQATLPKETLLMDIILYLLQFSGSHMTKVTCSSVALSDKAKYRRIRL